MISYVDLWKYLSAIEVLSSDISKEDIESLLYYGLIETDNGKYYYRTAKVVSLNNIFNILLHKSNNKPLTEELIKEIFDYCK